MTDWSRHSDNAMATYFPKREACSSYLWNNPTVSEVWLQSKITWGLLKILVSRPHSRPRQGLSSSTCYSIPDPKDCSMSGFPVHHQLLELAQTLFHWVSNTIQLSHPLSSPFPPPFNLSQNQGLFQWVSSSHQVAKVLEFQLQHQSFQWTPRTDLL